MIQAEVITANLSRTIYVADMDESIMTCSNGLPLCFHVWFDGSPATNACC